MSEMAAELQNIGAVTNMQKVQKRTCPRRLKKKDRRSSKVPVEIFFAGMLDSSKSQRRNKKTKRSRTRASQEGCARKTGEEMEQSACRNILY
jgi:hypothetical protein